MECAPAFDYARAKHSTEIVADHSHAGASQKKVLFKSEKLNLDLRYVAENTMDDVEAPVVKLDYLDLMKKGHLGMSAFCDLDLEEGQAVTFILRTPPEQQNPAVSQMTPTSEKAETLGVPLESTSNQPIILFRLIRKCRTYGLSL